MCVIMIADKDHPLKDQVAAMHRSNPHGMGIAWREGGKVHWRKGIMDPDEQHEVILSKPFPYVCHWRVPSIGPDIPQLNHPFTIDPQVSTELEGSTDGWVLVHNGHWGKWKEVLFEVLHTKNVKLPTGKWSDSRAIAFIAAQYGLGYLEFIGESTANRMFALGPKEDECELFGDGWTVKANPAIWVSNTHWEFRHVATPPTSGVRWHDHRGGNGHDIKDRLNDHRANADAWDKVGEVCGVKAPAQLPAAPAGGVQTLAPFDRAKMMYDNNRMSNKAWKKCAKLNQKGDQDAILGVIRRQLQVFRPKPNHVH